MKERITFVQHADHIFDPQQLQLSNHSLRIKSLKAARQDRLTLGLDQLPQEVLIPIQRLTRLPPPTLVDLYSYGEPSGNAMNYTYDGSHLTPTSP